jgi:hypothetical protein
MEHKCRELGKDLSLEQSNIVVFAWTLTFNNYDILAATSGQLDDIASSHSEGIGGGTRK